MGEYRVGYVAYHKEYRKRNHDKLVKRRRELYATDPVHRARRIQSAIKIPDRAMKMKRAYIMREYGMTMQEFDGLLAHQGHACAICGFSDQSDKKFFPLVDHDHETLAVRGILCNDCNLGLSRFKDDPARIRQALTYLEAPRG